MDLHARTTAYGSGNQAWMGSKHGINDAQTVTLDATKFTGIAVGGIIPSGVPLKRLDTGLYGPVEAAEDKLAGFLLTDQPANGSNQVAPLVWHGLIRVKRLPAKAFDVTTLTAANPSFTFKED